MHQNSVIMGHSALLPYHFNGGLRNEIEKVCIHTDRARQITCVSNEKQLGLAFLQYFQDNDERAPFFRVVNNPASDWWTARMLNWKDLVYPYVKSGGQAYNNGNPYPNHGSGGVMQCPDNTAAWSNSSVWWNIGTYNTPGAGGDETSRFPRSYAVNDYAGINENGSQNGGHFWPCVGDTSCNENQGATSTLQTPSTTIMVAETRMPFPDTNSAYLGYECTSGGQPAGGQEDSCIQGHTNGFSNFLFFDGHAKTLKALSTIQNDYWDAYASTGLGANQQKQDLAAAGTVPEWNPGF
jgi:prepilin-type processing-associated H-X9-DG protein